MEPGAISSLDFEIESSWENLIAFFFFFFKEVGIAWLIKREKENEDVTQPNFGKVLNTVSNKVLLAKWIQIGLDLDSSILNQLKAKAGDIEAKDRCDVSH
jgi:hypothetical protein